MRRSREFPTTPVCERILRATADFEEKFFTCKGTQAESLSREFIRKQRMPVRPLDTLIAIKVINLMPGLRQSDRRVGATLIEHFNRRTGRCDPGLNRLAEMLGLCVRTIIRSTQRLETVGLFRKVRHGGYSNRNSYEPNWASREFSKALDSWFSVQRSLDQQNCVLVQPKESSQGLQPLANFLGREEPNNE
jgi:predicted transcriptional regulator